jgi:hypothetical protein
MVVAVPLHIVVLVDVKSVGAVGAACTVDVFRVAVPDWQVMPPTACLT